VQETPIKVIAESACEPWFSDARVGTVCTIVQREDDPARRASNSVRFVRFLQPLSDILPTTRQEVLRQQAVDNLAHDIESISQDTIDARWQVRVVSQAELHAAGEMAASAPVSDTDELDEDLDDE
jgi:hypothetical protein